MSLANAELSAELRVVREHWAESGLTGEDQFDVFGSGSCNGEVKPRITWTIRVAGEVSFDNTRMRRSESLGQLCVGSTGFRNGRRQLSVCVRGCGSIPSAAWMSSSSPSCAWKIERRVWAERKVHLTSSRSLRRSGKCLAGSDRFEVEPVNKFLRRPNFNRGENDSLKPSAIARMP